MHLCEIDDHEVILVADDGNKDWRLTSKADEASLLGSYIFWTFIYISHTWVAPGVMYILFQHDLRVTGTVVGVEIRFILVCSGF